MDVGIVSVGIGNVASVKNMIARVGHSAELLHEPPKTDYHVVILPGVGAFDNGIERLRQSGWYDWLKTHENIKEKKTKITDLFGIQPIDGSEGRKSQGARLIPVFKRFSFSSEEAKAYKVRNMGWNNVKFDFNKAPWAKEIPEDSRFYFVHSYYYKNDSDHYIIGTSEYGITYASVIQNENVIGFQFHPEKSHRYGKLLLRIVLQ